MSEKYNSNAVQLRSLNYPKLRGRVIRTHNQIYHKYPDETPPLDIPADTGGDQA